MSARQTLTNFNITFKRSRFTTHILSFNSLTTTSLTSATPSPYCSIRFQSHPLRYYYYTTTATRTKMSPLPLPGGCYCGAVRYTITLEDPENQARTSICHCGNCKKFTGGEHGITTKIPRSAFAVTEGRKHVRTHEADNGSGTVLHREFCGTCGGPLLEYGANAGENIYVFYGTMEDHARGQVQPKGEFFCKLRDPWMPEVSGLFQKWEIKE